MGGEKGQKKRVDQVVFFEAKANIDVYIATLYWVL